jgi:hypothetical protein
LFRQIYLDHVLELCGVYITDFTLLGDPKNIGGCGLCYEKMMHPASGGAGIGAE